MKNIYSYLNYRSYLKDWLEQSHQMRGLRSRMAVFLKCQNSHLTRVLSQEVHLTNDQAYETTLYLKFDEKQTDYFLKLVEFERSGSPLYRDRLKNELQKIQASHENIAERLPQKTATTTQQQMTYYSSWYWSAIHIICSIEKFQTIKSISQRLNLREEMVLQAMKQLEEFGLVKRNGTKWICGEGAIHLSRDSAMNTVQHQNWRRKAIDACEENHTKGFHLTVVQSISKQDFSKIKELLLSTLDSYISVADKSPPEELVCFSADFFEVP